MFMVMSMKRLLQYARLRWRPAALFALFAAIFCVVFALYRLPAEAVGYAALLCLLPATFLAAADFARFCARLERLERLRETVGLGLTQMPPASNALEEAYQSLLRALWDEHVRAVSRADAAMGDMRDYNTLWAHQIKTPIAAMRLLLAPESEAARELFKIEQYLEMLLSYVRLESESTDLVLRACDLDEILRRASRKFALFFIRQGVRLDYAPTGRSVLTDEKWFSFAVEQVLSNAIKYTPAGTISLRVEGDFLVVADTGIGIAPEDLPRVFERGYTGYNGRTERKSTGIGLYLTRRVLAMLGHEIAIESAPGQGTRVRIGLARPNLGE